MAENRTRIPTDEEHLLAVAIQNAWNGDFSLIDRLRAEIASTTSSPPVAPITAERGEAGGNVWSEHSPQEIVRRTRCEADAQHLATSRVSWRDCCDVILKRLGPESAPAPIQDGASSLDGDGLGKFTCAARRQGTADGNDPADCDWPVCGCDPYADKVIAALQESGHLVPASLATRRDSGMGAGASPLGSGSQASPEAPMDLRPSGVDPSRGPADQSVDTALATFKHEFPGWAYALDECHLDTHAWICPDDGTPSNGYDGWGETMAEAILDAIRNARAAQGIEAEGRNTEGGSVHEGPVSEADAPVATPQVDPRKEALAVLKSIPKVFAKPEDYIDLLRRVAESWSGRTRQGYLDQADRIEAALATLRAEEQDGEVRS